MRNAFGDSYEARDKMIHETSAWLTWALDNDVPVPRIPRNRVDRGGFDMLRRVPAARAAVDHWWRRTLDLVDRMK